MTMIKATIQRQRLEVDVLTCRRIGPMAPRSKSTRLSKGLRATPT